ncbi:EamA-like transporter family protein [Shimia gijangensis]|uniref:EamA-like transporter family protein n=1 Tax=Shimia gijangensis TaxID=1470563 RepID=A0A1M6QV49_9RHOB|nr:DMT family transporter [Shimia gijangensis]SHK24111.1 EamA-like transporter family protein [Shimia gijangensis]
MRLSSPTPGFASAAVFISASAWGLYWIPLRALDSQGIGGSWGVALLNAPGAVVLAIVVLFQLAAHRGHMREAAAIGLVTGLGMALYGVGIVHTTVMRATLLFYLTPVWATLIGIVWLEEKATVMRWVAIGVGLIGLLLLVSGGSNTVPLGVGDVFAFFSGIAWAMGAAMIKKYEGVPLPGMTMFQFASTAFFGLLLGAVAGVLEVPSLEALRTAIPYATLISIAFIIPAVMILFWAQKFLFPGRVGLLMMSEVLVAGITASLFLPEERMSGIEWAGAVLILGACLVEVLLTPSDQTSDHTLDQT